MSTVIQVSNLAREFKVKQKQPGLTGSIKALFRPNYKVIKAVDGISFDIQAGEMVGFIGPNGAGKTTTLKMLSGLLYPTSGQVRVLGYTPFDRKHDFLRQISLVMGQKQQLFWDLPAIETFRLNQHIYQISDKQYRTVLSQLVDLLQLDQIIHQPVRKLSLGQRMKCELVAALLHTPKVLFLDEPTIGLDVVSQKNLRQFIKQYNQKYGSSVILTSHYMGDVQELCPRVIIIHHGRLGYDGPLDKLVKQYATHKTITLVFNQPVRKKQLAGWGKLIEFAPLRAALSVKRSQVSQTAAQILEALPVEDLDISETSIEEIIRHVFETNSQA